MQNLCLLVSRRQSESERRAPSYLGLGRNGAAMAFDDAFHDREADAGASRAAGIDDAWGLPLFCRRANLILSLCDVSRFEG
jgi:hypothetical protein